MADELAPSTTPADVPAPDAVEPHAVLRLVGGAGHVELRADPAVEELYRASYEPSTPDVTLETDKVTVRYSLHRLLGRLSSASESTSRFALSTRQPWDISAPDGVATLDADLSAVRLLGLRIGHGAGTVRLRLSAPTGTVPLVIGGGSTEVIVFRPAGIMVRVSTQGDVARVVVDGGRAIGPLSGSTSVEPPGYALSVDRYDISITGGCASLLVATEPISQG
jgi:hypothetical protein